MGLKYIGDGSAVRGVPARDLTDEEEALYGPKFDEQEGVKGGLVKSGLYEKAAKAAEKE